MIAILFSSQLIVSHNGFLFIQSIAFLFIPLLIAMALLAIYLIMNKNKEKMGFLKNSYAEEINVLKNMNEKLLKEVTICEAKLEHNQKEKLDWQEEKNKLKQEIKDLKDEIKNLQKKDNNEEEDDIIIEYYTDAKTQKK